MNLSKNVKVTQLLGYFAAGQTVRKSAILDMAGYEGVMFVYSFGTILDTGVIACGVNGNTTNATGGTALTAATATATVTATTASLTSSAIVTEVYQPDPATSRYLEAMITPTVANTVILGIVAIQYQGKVKPEITTQLLATAFAVSP